MHNSAAANATSVAKSSPVFAHEMLTAMTENNECALSNTTEVTNNSVNYDQEVMDMTDDYGYENDLTAVRGIDQEGTHAMFAEVDHKVWTCQGSKRKSKQAEQAL